MKILLVGEFWQGSLALSYYNALKNIDCEISQFDFLKEYQGVNCLSKNRFVNKLIGEFFYKSINKRLLKRVEQIKPKAILVIKGFFLFPETLKGIKKIYNCLLLNVNPDNPFNLLPGPSNEFIRKSIPFYDCYFIWGKFLIPRLIQAGAKHVEYLPFAYDPNLHFPVDISNGDKKIYGNDIAFIGTWDREREEWLEYLKEYDLSIWGNSWEKLKKDSPLKSKLKSKVAIGEDFSKVCRASKIVLNFVRKQNRNAHNMRTFEVPACKGFMLTTRTKEQNEFFEEGKEIVCFETAEELIEKIKYYLPKDELRNQVGINAYKKIQSHTYSERAKSILEICKKLKS